jgi:large subunit ribosomal protein L32e
MPNKKFIRTHANRHSKLGKGRKKLQKWRKPTGRDNKVREKKKGYPVKVSVGFKNKNRIIQAIIRNISDLTKIGDNQKPILGKVGAKKKLEIIKKAQEMKIKLSNVHGKKQENKK